MTRLFLPILVVLTLGACGDGEASFPNVDFDGDPPNNDQPNNDVNNNPNNDPPPNNDVNNDGPNNDVNNDPPPNNDPNNDVNNDPGGFDLDAFQATVMPPLEAKCSTPNTCHGTPGAFGQQFEIAAGGDPQANLDKISAMLDLNSPADSPLLVRGQDAHRGQVLVQAEACGIFEWIYTGIEGQDAPPCPF